MAESKLTPEQWEALLKEYKEGASIYQLSKKYDYDHRAMSRYMKRHGWLDSDRSSTESKKLKEPTELTDDEAASRVKHDREISGYQTQISNLNRLYRSALRDTSLQDMMTVALRDTVQALPAHSSLSIRQPDPMMATGHHTAGLLLSDLHVGEVVNFEVTGGMNEYNLDIFRNRMGYLLDLVINLIDLRRGKLDIPKLTILADGDFISGLIHDELLKTNQVNVMEQTMFAACIVAHIIMQLSHYFEEIHFSGTVGNHGRNQQKREHKETYVNWDYICYQMIAQFLRDQENVTFDIPKSKWQITKIENVEFLHFHGDGIKMWAGFPWYGVNRAVKNLRESLTLGDRTFDAVALAHFHVPNRYEAPMGPWIVNGCVKGADEFALNALHSTIRPIQTLFFVHHRVGVLGDEPLYLDVAKEEHGKIFPDNLLPSVWANKKMLPA